MMVPAVRRSDAWHSCSPARRSDSESFSDNTLPTWATGIMAQMMAVWPAGVRPGPLTGRPGRGSSCSCRWVNGTRNWPWLGKADSLAMPVAGWLGTWMRSRPSYNYVTQGAYRDAGNGYVRVWPGQAHWQRQRAARCQAPRQTRTDSEVPLAAKALLPSYVQPAIQVQCLRLPRLGLQSLRPWLTIMIDNFLPIMIFRRFSLWAASVCQCQMLLSTSKFLFLLKDMMRFKCRDRDKLPSGWSRPFRVLPSLRSAWAARARQSFKFQVPSEPGVPDSEAVDRDHGRASGPGLYCFCVWAHRGHCRRIRVRVRLATPGWLQH